MRLSSRLLDKNKRSGEVEAIIDLEKYISLLDKNEGIEDIEDKIIVSDGDFIEIQIGTIILPFYSMICKDSVSFISPKKLHCLIINNTMISIDCQMHCMDYDKDNSTCQKCNHYVQAWFLVGADDIFAALPNVYVVKENFKLPENIKMSIEMEDTYSEWLAKAEIAYKERLGAGAVIYLRSILEQITIEVGNNVGAEIHKKNGNIKPFDQVLSIVDKKCSIIPAIYSDNGYNLFRKLSNIAHGNADEETALREYVYLRRLVVGVIENIKKKEDEIKSNAEIKKALEAVGFSNESEVLE